MQAGRFGPFGWFVPIDTSRVNTELLKFSWIEEEAIWSFLYDYIQHPTFRRPYKFLVNIHTLEIWERFRVERKSCRSSEQLKKHFLNVMAQKLHCADMPLEAKIELYFGLDIPLEKNLYEKLIGASCEVVLDQRNCIQYFYDPHGGVELRQEQHNFPPRLGVGQEQFIWEWLLNYIEDTNTGHIMRGHSFRNQENDWNKFVRDTKFPVSAKRCLQNFQFYMVPTLYTSQLDLFSKIKLTFALELKVTKEIAEQLSPKDIIMVDQNGRIQSYTDKFGTRLNVDDIVTYGETRPENKGQPFTDQEDITMLRYMLSFSKDSENRSIKVIRHLFDNPSGWEKLVTSEYNIHSRNAQTYHKRFHNILIRSLDRLPIDSAMKLALHCTLLVPASDQYLEDLSKLDFVEFDELGRITAVYNRRTAFADPNKLNLNVFFTMNAENQV